MDYGNTAKHVRKVAIAGLVIGASADLIATICIASTEQWSQAHFIFLIPIALIPFVGLVSLVFLTTLFCLRVEDEKIQHLFLKKFVLSEKRIEDLVAIELDHRMFAAILIFRDSFKIHFWAAYVGQIGMLVEDLQEVTNGRIQIKDV